VAAAESGAGWRKRRSRDCEKWWLLPGSHLPLTKLLCGGEEGDWRIGPALEREIRRLCMGCTSDLGDGGREEGIARILPLCPYNTAGRSSFQH